MRNLRFPAMVAALLFVGAACIRTETSTDIDDVGLPQAVQPAPPQGDTPVSATVPARPTYALYSAEAVAQAQAEGRPVLLYFWASWCPICRAEEPKLQASIEGGTTPVAGFRVNFDTEAELKKKFRVPYQHTTIILNAKGEETARFTGPVAEAELTAALAAAAK